MSSTRATLFGFLAILMWSLLALLTAASGRVPPFQLAAMTFLIGGDACFLGSVFSLIQLGFHFFHVRVGRRSLFWPAVEAITQIFQLAMNAMQFA